MILSLVFAVAQCVVTYDAPRSTALPAAAVIAGVADFNGDGVSDAVIGDAVYVSLRDRVVVLAPGETALRVTDVNGDGRPDILAASEAQLIALLNNGNGTFTRKTTPAAVTPSALLFADFNGDGVLDAFAPGVQVHLGNGDGTFRPENGMAFTGNARWVAADVNGDGRDDLVAVGFNPGQVIVYRREANGFAAGQLGPFVMGRPAAIADFDRDGRDDILFVPDSVSASTALYFNVGGVAARENVGFEHGAYAVADFNADGVPDLLGGFTPPDTAEVTVRTFLNDGKGTLQTRDAVTGFDAMPAIADVDGDGLADLLGLRAGAVYAIHGNGDGTFRLPRTALGPATSAASGDFDGDGDDDVALPEAIGWNNGDNTFRITQLGVTISRVFAAGDVDGDGKAELVVQNAGALEVMRASDPRDPVARFEASAFDAAIGDFSGQHRPEIAAVIGNQIQVFEPRPGAAPRYVTTPDRFPRAIAAADVDGDGADDLIAVGGTQIFSPICCSLTTKDGHVSVYLSTGSSFAAERRTDFAPAGFNDVVTGDFDGDGRTDVAVSTQANSRKIVVFYGDRTGVFARRQEITVASNDNLYALRADDLNGDGITDLAVNGAQPVFSGTSAGLVNAGSYFGPLVWATLTVRASRDALPAIVGIPRNAPNALIDRPFCARRRAVK